MSVSGNEQPVQANVVLTADTSQYDQSINASAANTDALGKSIDSLATKLSNITKSAGRHMTHFAIGDVAGIVAATTAYGAFEKQMASLNAQAAVLNRTVDGQQRTFNTYASQVNRLRDTFGTSTQEAAALVQTLTRVSDNTSSVGKMADTFTRLGAATQGSSVALAQSMTQLSRSMGTPQRAIGQYADQLTVLSARSNASAQSIVDFANQLAPVGRMVGMSQTDIMGISAAFQKAGQDGYQAANGFAKMMGDIAYASQTGSPDLAKYANLVGMTVGQFKELGGTDQYLKIFQAINRQGPQAITTLNRLGLDGLRMQRSIAAMAQQGGPGAEILAARNADPNAMRRGARAATDNMANQLNQLRESSQRTAEEFGQNFAPAASKVLDVLDGISRVIREITGGPLGHLAAGVAAVAAPFAAVAGSILMASKALAMFAGANQLLRNNFTFGVAEGRRGFGAIGQEGMPLGPAGLRAAQRGNFVQRAMFNAGARLGGAFQTEERLPYLTDANGNPVLDANGMPRLRGTMTGRLGGYAMTGVGGLARFAGYQYNAGVWGPFRRGPLDDPNARERFFSSPSFREAWANGPGGFRGNLANAMSGWGNGLRSKYMAHTIVANAYPGGMPSDSELRDAGKNLGVANPQRLNDAVQTFMKSAGGMSSAMDHTSKGAMTLSRGFSNMVSGMGALARNMGGAALGAGATAGRGLLTMGRGVATSAYQGLLGGNPWMLGITAATGLYSLYKAMSSGYGTGAIRDVPSLGGGYLQNAGVTAPSPYTRSISTKAITRSQAHGITRADYLTAGSSTYKLSNPELKGKSAAEAMTMIAPNMGQISNNPQALQNLKLDLLNQYGGATGSRMFEELKMGAGNRTNQVVHQAFNQPGAHWWTLTPNADKVASRFNNLASAFSSQMAYASQNLGPQAAQRLQSHQMGQLLMQSAAAANARNMSMAPHYVTNMQSGQTSVVDPLGVQRQELGMSMTRQLFGTSVGKNVADRMRYLQHPANQQQAMRYWLSNFFGPNAVVGDNYRRNILESFNINQPLQGQQAITRLLAAISGQTSAGTGPTLAERIAQVQGGNVFGLSAVRTAIAQPGNVNAQLVAVQKMVQSLQDAGRTAPQIERIMGNIRAVVKDASSPQYQLAEAAMQQAQQYQAWRMPTLSPTAQFGAQLSQTTAIMGIQSGDPMAKQLQQGAIDQMQQVAESTRERFVSLLTQQREYNVSRQRAEEDFATQRSRMEYQYNLQRSRAEHDYQQQRQWAEQDYQRQRAREEQSFDISQRRSTFDFWLSQHRAQQDFNIQRNRDERDFHHQQVMMVQQSAQQMMDIYQRVAVSRTDSAQFLLSNMADQQQRMVEQEQQLNRLRNMGLSNRAIQQLDLTNPDNQQQLARLTDEIMSNPQLIQQFNQGIAKRTQAAAALVKDKSSLQWQEFVRQHNIAVNRAEQDFQRQTQRSLDDFHRQMNRSEADFQRSMHQQQQDYTIQMQRQQTEFDTSMQRSEQDYNTAVSNMVTDFNKQMTRAAEDLNRSATTIDGSLMQILNRSVKHLSGHARKQAQTIIDEFDGLKKKVTPGAVDTMMALAQIFGVKYTAPRGYGTHTGVGHAGHGQSYVSGGQGGHLLMPGGGGPGGSRTPQKPEDPIAPVPGPVGYPYGAKNSMYAKGYHTGEDFPVGVGTPIHAVLPGTVAVAGPGGAYGNYVIIDHGHGLQTLYAHQSRVAAHPGEQVRENQVIGYTGATGNVTGPHLHFEVRMNGQDVNPDILGHLMRQTGAGHAFGAKGMQGAALALGRGNLAAVLNRSYPGLERYVAGFSGAHVFAPGDISGVLNRFAGRAATHLEHLGYQPHLGLGSPAMSSGTLHNPPAHIGSYVTMGKMMAEKIKGWKGREWTALYDLWQRESGWNPYADNPTSSAYGIPQALIGPGKVPHGYYDNYSGTFGSASSHYYGGDPATQIKWGLNYIANTYGDPLHAWAHETSAGWYGDGGIFGNGAKKIGVGERGPEMVMPLNQRGVDFLVALMNRLNVGAEGRNQNVAGRVQPVCAHTMNNYAIDRSTTFTGAISVAANDPNALVAQLRARERQAALTRPTTGGRRVP